jgi:hypothetical protein
MPNINFSNRALTVPTGEKIADRPSTIASRFAAYSLPHSNRYAMMVWTHQTSCCESSFNLLLIRISFCRVTVCPGRWRIDISLLSPIDVA